MAYSYVEYVGTAGGTTGPFSYGSVALLDADTESISTQIKVYKNGTLLTLTTDYTIDTINEEVTTNVAIYNTDILRVVRETKSDARYVDYIDSTNVTAELLDLDSNQLFYLIQETKDLTTDALTKGVDGQWNAQGRRIGNMASAVNGTDAVTLNQLSAAVVGALPATLSGIGTLIYSGDGATTNFALPAAISTITDASDVEVYINGLRQRPTTHYTIVSGNVQITPAPGSSDRIMLAYPEGTVSAMLTANSVTTASIQDDAVTPAKLSNGTNGQVLTTSGIDVVWSNVAPANISGFDAQVQLSRLDQMAAPTASVSVNSQRITNLSSPSSANDAANKSYVDSTVSGYVQASSGSVTTTGSNNDIIAQFTTSIANLAGVTLTVPVYNVTTDTTPNQFINISWAMASGLYANDALSGNNYPLRTVHRSINGNNDASVHTYFTRGGATNNTLTVNIVRQGTPGGFNFKAGSTVYAAFTKGAS